MLKTLPCLELYHIHYPVYLGIFNNDSYNDIKFLFFSLIIRTFQQNLKRDCFLTTTLQFQCSTQST